MHRAKGDALLELPVSDHKEAETCLRKAIDVARAQQVKSFELQASISLARLWQTRGDRHQAYALLGPICHWFTEGFGTKDLQDAKTLLAALS